MTNHRDEVVVFGSLVVVLLLILALSAVVPLFY